MNFIHTGFSEASVARLHGHSDRKIWLRIFLSIPAILGVLLASFVEIPSYIENSLISLVVGILLFIIVRELIPEREAGEPVFFSIGLVIFIIIYVLNLYF
jgi:zinc transporter ZupT